MEKSAKIIRISMASLFVGSLLTATLASGASVWIEGESAFKSNMQQNPWLKGENPKILSANDTFAGLMNAADLPNPCFILYKVQIPEDGSYQFWMRQSYKGHMGKTRVRFLQLGPDGKPAKTPGAEEGWTELDLDSPVFDQKPNGSNRTIEWVKYEAFKLTKGDYILDMQVTGPNPGHTEANPPIWMMIDVIHLTTEPFTPIGALKPGEKPSAQPAGKTDYY